MRLCVYMILFVSIHLELDCYRCSLSVTMVIDLSTRDYRVRSHAVYAVSPLLNFSADVED